jgi:hypothetical protein
VFALGVIVSLCYIPGMTGAAIPTQYAVLSAVLPFTLWRQGQFTIFHGLGIAFCFTPLASLVGAATFTVAFMGSGWSALWL